MELKIKAISPKIGNEIPAPHFATAGSAAMDVCACIDEPITLAAGERRLIPAGFAIALPSPEYVALVFARSGLASKRGLAPANKVGVIDPDYRGEIMVALYNQSPAPQTVLGGERIAQLVERYRA